MTWVASCYLTSKTIPVVTWLYDSHVHLACEEVADDFGLVGKMQIVRGFLIATAMNWLYVEDVIV